MHNNRYSTVEGVMRLFTADHPQITLSPRGVVRGGGYPAPSPADLLCFVATAAHSWVLVGTPVVDGYAFVWAGTKNSLKVTRPATVRTYGNLFTKCGFLITFFNKRNSSRKSLKCSIMSRKLKQISFTFSQTLGLVGFLRVRDNI